MAVNNAKLEAEASGKKTRCCFGCVSVKEMETAAGRAAGPELGQGHRQRQRQRQLHSSAAGGHCASFVRCRRRHSNHIPP